MGNTILKRMIFLHKSLQGVGVSVASLKYFALALKYWMRL